MKKLIVSCLLLALSSTVISAASSDDAFYKKVSKSVWSMNAPAFDPLTEIPDSVSDGVSAVIIARQINVDAKLIERNTVYKSTGVTSTTDRTYIERVMVKLLDDNAVEDFAEFEVGAGSKVKNPVMTFSSSTYAFGARIHKPDGRIEDVDLSNAYKVSSGKKGNKEESRKIAIPGLEPGDVLEYFNAVNRTREERSLKSFALALIAKYPTLSFSFEGVFDPRLTVEYRTYNGAPLLNQGKGEKDRNILSITLKNLPASESARYVNEARQYPFISMNTLNNTATMAYVPSTSRPAGVRVNLPTGTYYRDISNVYHDVTFDCGAIGKAVKMTKAYSKENPGVSPRGLADYAWLAFAYNVAIDPTLQVEDFAAGIYFADVLRRLEIFPPEQVGLGFVNSRFDVPTSEISSWQHPDFVTYAADTIYSVAGLLYCLPGEMPGKYQGEKGGTYTGDRSKLGPRSVPTIFEIPKSRAKLNEFEHTATARLADDRSRLVVDRSVKANGAAKRFFEGLTNDDEWIAGIEDYLGIPANKRYRNKKADPEGRKTELDEFMLDEAETNLGVRPESVDSYEIVSRGFVPGHGSIEFNSTCTVDGLVVAGGQDLLVSIGRLFRDVDAVKPHERERHTDVFLHAPEMYRYTLSLDVPDGYTVSDESLAGLSTNVANQVGQFVTMAKATDEGRKVEIKMMHRVNHYVISSDFWPELLAIDEAAASFNEAVLVLAAQ